MVAGISLCSEKPRVLAFPPADDRASVEFRRAGSQRFGPIQIADFDCCGLGYRSGGGCVLGVADDHGGRRHDSSVFASDD